MDRAHRYSVIWVSLLVAQFLQIMPLPQMVSSWRPDWVLLVLAYWTVALPNRVGVLTVFLMGLLLDVLLGATMGVRSLALSLAIYLVAIRYQKLRHYSWVQQMSNIGSLSLVIHLMVYAVETLNTDIELTFEYLQPVVLTSLLWPWVFWLMHRIRRHYKVR